MDDVTAQWHSDHKHVQIISCSSQLKIGVQTGFFIAYLAKAITFLVYQKHQICRLRWPIWFGLAASFLILLLRLSRAIKEFQASFPISMLDEKQHLQTHCLPMSARLLTLCDQFVPISLFIMAYIDYKIFRLCYSTEADEKRSCCQMSGIMVSVATVLFGLQSCINYSGHVLREQAVGG